MYEAEQPVLDKILAFRADEVIDNIQATAHRKKWNIINMERREGFVRMTIRLSPRPADFVFEVSGIEPRTIGSSMKIPQTHLIVRALDIDHKEGDTEELTKALHIAFMRGGG